MDNELMKQVLASVSPRSDERFYEAVRRSPEEMQAKWNAIAMRNMVAQQGQNLVEVIKARVTDLEAKLQTDESLSVYCDAGKDQIRVESFEFPNWHLAVVAGLDEQGNRAYRIENVQDVKLTCKIVKSPRVGSKIGFVLPAEGGK
ncbi:MAG TPA: hypothetical protein VKU19_13585 [Bryobacteraceae bacterium]|nr:hypothetical protein [Bryobacteraceae bacterium]